MYLRVLVTPGATTENILDKGEGSIDISVKEKAERNMANNRVLELLLEYLNVSKNKIRVINGHRNRSRVKMISVHDG